MMDTYDSNDYGTGSDTTFNRGHGRADDGTLVNAEGVVFFKPPRKASKHMRRVERMRVRRVEGYKSLPLNHRESGAVHEPGSQQL